MHLPLQITLRDMPPSAALEVHLHNQVEKLEEFSMHLISCRILLEMVHQHHQQGTYFNVRIDLGVPGNEIVVNLHHHQDLHMALRDAFDIAKPQLEGYAHRLQRETKLQVAEQIGYVARIFHQQGFGLISGSDGIECYFNCDNMVNLSFDRLKAGDEVKFVGAVGADGLQVRGFNGGPPPRLQ